VSPHERPGDRLVYVTPFGEPAHPSSLGVEFERATQQARLPRIRLHDLRHSAVSALLESGTPIHIVATYAGHDPAMTLRVYSHVTERALSAASETFAAMFGTR
jgi:integrase